MENNFDIELDIIRPVEEYLAGRITENEIDWYNWNSALYTLRRVNFWGVREALTPYYHKFLMANKAFFRNGSTDTQLKNALLKSIEREGRYAGRIFNDVDIVKAVGNWGVQLMADNHEPRYFFMLMQTILRRDYKPDWNAVYEQLKMKLAKARNYGNFKTHEMYCLLMGITMIERTSLPREKKDELVGLMRRHWQLACKKSSYPFMHWFYKAFKENFDALCPEGLIDTHSGKSVREQALVHMKKMEDIIKSTNASTELDELFAILFPKVIKDVLRQSRPKTYEELEAAVDDLTNRYNKVLEQLTAAVKDVESDKISADDLTAAFLRFPTQLALSFFGSMSTLLALNPTWQKYAPKIQEQILAKQEADRIHVEGDYVIEKNVEREVSHVAAGGTGFSIN